MDSLKCISMSPDTMLLSEENSPLEALVKDFARVLCAQLKEEPRLDVEGVRKQTKLWFHKPSTVTRRNFADQLVKLGQSLAAVEETDGLSFTKAFFERLSFKLGLYESSHLCECVRRIATTWNIPPWSSTHDAAGKVCLKTLTSACSGCSQTNSAVLCVRVPDEDKHELMGTALCTGCWFFQTSRLQGSWRVFSMFGPTEESAKLSHVPPTHLLAHQRNIWENKAGTRHAVLPDSRHAVLTTTKHEMKNVGTPPLGGLEDKALHNHRPAGTVEVESPDSHRSGGKSECKYLKSESMPKELRKVESTSSSSAARPQTLRERLQLSSGIYASQSSGLSRPKSVVTHSANAPALRASIKIPNPEQTGHKATKEHLTSGVEDPFVLRMLEGNSARRRGEGVVRR